MIVALLGSAAVATLIALLLSRSILEPIRAVTHAARAMARGDLEQVVPVLSRDELGELAGAFNAMARTHPRVPAGRDRQAPAGAEDGAGDDRLVPRPGGGRRPGGLGRAGQPGGPPPPRRRPRRTGRSPGSPPPPLRPALAEVLGGRPDHLPTGLEHALCLRDDGQERFFLPRVLAIRGEDGPLGAAVVLQDVTKFRLVDQLKSDMVSTVSHELKTPLTSIQMAVHLLLEEAVGPLDAQAGRAAAGGPAGLGPAAGDGQRPARPDPDRAGTGPARPRGTSRRRTWSARPSSGSRPGRGMPAWS